MCLLPIPRFFGFAAQSQRDVRASRLGAPPLRSGGWATLSFPPSGPCRHPAASRCARCGRHCQSRLPGGSGLGASWTSFTLRASVDDFHIVAGQIQSIGSDPCGHNCGDDWLPQEGQAFRCVARTEHLASASTMSASCHVCTHPLRDFAPVNSQSHLDLGDHGAEASTDLSAAGHLWV